MQQTRFIGKRTLPCLTSTTYYPQCQYQGTMYGDWMSLLAYLLPLCAVERTSGWVECSISPQDKWKLATERIPAMRMREEYERGYTCRKEAGNKWIRW